MRRAVGRTVGIFSREDDSGYTYLCEALGSQDNLVREVRPFHISNTGWRAFHEEVSRCDIAILYHSKRRGRLNITDVTDSLYDDDLKYLSAQLGKDHVIVVADHVDSSSWEEKERILKNQPLIKDKATDFILFSKEMPEEKKMEEIKQIIRRISSTSLSHYFQAEAYGPSILRLTAFIISYIMFPVISIFKITTSVIQFERNLLRTLKETIVTLLWTPLRTLLPVFQAIIVKRNQHRRHSAR